MIPDALDGHSPRPEDEDRPRMRSTEEPARRCDDPRENRPVGSPLDAKGLPTGRRVSNGYDTRYASAPGLGMSGFSRVSRFMNSSPVMVSFL